MKNILIRGERSAGKSTLIRRVITRYGHDARIAGFFTEKTEVRTVILRAWDNFSLTDEGPSAVVYTKETRKIEARVFEELGVWAIERAIGNADLIVMDELGRFEQGCALFVKAVSEALRSPVPLVASMKKERNPFLDALSVRDDVMLFDLETGTRNETREAVFTLLDVFFPDVPPLTNPGTGPPPPQSPGFTPFSRPDR